MSDSNQPDNASLDYSLDCIQELSRLIAHAPLGTLGHNVQSVILDCINQIEYEIQLTKGNHMTINLKPGDELTLKVEPVEVQPDTEAKLAELEWEVEALKELVEK